MKDFDELQKEASEKFWSCKYGSSCWCTAIEHNVGVNGYSILAHCGSCKKYEGEQGKKWGENIGTKKEKY